MIGTFEVYFKPNQVDHLRKIEEFLGVNFITDDKTGVGFTVSTHSEGFADEIIRLRDRLTGIDTFA